MLAFGCVRRVFRLISQEFYTSKQTPL